MPPSHIGRRESMKKNMKYFSLFLVIILLGLFIFRIFSPVESTVVVGAEMNGSESSWLEVFLSWVPMLIFAGF